MAVDYWLLVSAPLDRELRPDHPARELVRVHFGVDLGWSRHYPYKRYGSHAEVVKATLADLERLPPATSAALTQDNERLIYVRLGGAITVDQSQTELLPLFPPPATVAPLPTDL